MRQFYDPTGIRTYTKEHSRHGIPWRLSTCANSVYQVLFLLPLLRTWEQDYAHSYHNYSEATLVGLHISQFHLQNIISRFVCRYGSEHGMLGGGGYCFQWQVFSSSKIFSFLFLCHIRAKPGYTTQSNACSLYAL